MVDVALVIAYAAPVLAWLAVEFRGIWSTKDDKPAYTEIIRSVFRRYPAVKAAAFAGWLWLGFHFFLPQVPFA